MEAKRMGQTIADGIRNNPVPVSLIGAALLLLIAERIGQEGKEEAKRIHVERSVTIARDPDELYRFWRNFQNLPQILPHLESVREHDGRSRWTASGPMDSKVEWDVEVTDDRPGEMIAWHSLEGSDIRTEGAVSFRRAQGNRGTEVKVSYDFIAPGGSAGTVLSKILRSPSAEMREGLRHFKQIMEAGELPTNVRRRLT